MVNVALRASITSSGHNCTGAERFYVHKNIYSSFVDKISERVKAITVVSMSWYYIHVCI